jgi:hypothetical protein
MSPLASPGIRKIKRQWDMKIFSRQEGRLMRRIQALQKIGGKYSCICEQYYKLTDEILELETQHVEVGALTDISALHHGLEVLGHELEAINQNLPHGDINVKNVIWTGQKFVLIDWEPLLEIAHGNVTVLRGTRPYISKRDYIRGELTKDTDKLGFFYFCRKTIYGWFPTLESEVREFDDYIGRLKFSSILHVARNCPPSRGLSNKGV